MVYRINRSQLDRFTRGGSGICERCRRKRRPQVDENEKIQVAKLTKPPRRGVHERQVKVVTDGEASQALVRRQQDVEGHDLGRAPGGAGLLKTVGVPLTSL